MTALSCFTGTAAGPGSWLLCQPFGRTAYFMTGAFSLSLEKNDEKVPFHAKMSGFSKGEKTEEADLMKTRRVSTLVFLYCQVAPTSEGGQEWGSWAPPCGNVN